MIRSVIGLIHSTFQIIIPTFERYFRKGQINVTPSSHEWQASDRIPADSSPPKRCYFMRFPCDHDARRLAVWNAGEIIAADLQQFGNDKPGQVPICIHSARDSSNYPCLAMLRISDSAIFCILAEYERRFRTPQE
jgi:hypothetical protein